MKQQYALGIDAGGTYTDAVLLSHADDDKVVSCAKTFTTPSDPSVGIRAVLSKLDESLFERVSMVSLATTFATNAIVEERGAEAGLILVGYNELPPEIPRHTRMLMVEGGHTVSGEERTPLNLGMVERKLDTFLNGLEAIAVAAFFSVRNPEHEIKVAQLIRSRYKLPVVRGHRLSIRLDALKRATTAWWNARLIPLISNLIDAVRTVLAEMRIQAPFMVVRGDGTLMSAETALERPVDTLLSGPAASILGAKHLSGLKNALIVDMGGTTTDMAVLSGGKVAIDPQGARVGKWKTHVQAAKVRTIGLGGDSFIGVNADKKISVGPRKVIPLSVIAEREPQIIDMLRMVLRALEIGKVNNRSTIPCSFYLRNGAPNSSKHLNFPDYLNQGIVNDLFLSKNFDNWFSISKLESYERDGLLIRSSLTPTDIRIATGRVRFGNKDAADLGLTVFARHMGMTEAAFAETVEEEIQKRLCLEAVTHIGDKNDEALCQVVDRWFKPVLSHKPNGVDLKISVSLNAPIIGVGAPAAAYIPEAFKLLHAECVIPKFYEMSVAVGSVVGIVDYKATGVIRMSESARFSLHTDAGKEDFDLYEDAMLHGRRIIEAIARERMRKDYVKNPLLQFSKNEKKVKTGHGDEVLLEAELCIRATGRPDVMKQTDVQVRSIAHEDCNHCKT